MIDSIEWMSFLPLVITLAGSGVILALCHYLLLVRRSDLGSEAKLPRQITLLVLTISSLILVIIVSPLTESTRNQMLSLIGIMISGVIAFSSTSFVTNFMAAIMLRVTRPFKLGDMITIDGQFGKVADRGLFDTEIQTESRELIAIPNATFITSSVKVTHSDGIIVSTSLSLGYDVHHALVEKLLIQAAEKSGLADAYVHILELGDYAVTYRVSGLLPEVSTVITSRSRLNSAVLDVLHEAGIEIMSPAFTRMMQLPPGVVQIPVGHAEEQAPRVAAEDVAFEKANQAQEVEQIKLQVQVEIKAVKDQLSEATGEDKTRLSARLKALEEQLARSKAEQDESKSS